MPTLAHRLTRFFRHSPSTYVVGGAVRDRLLGREVHDFDLVVDDDGLLIARQLADALGGAFVTLDADLATARVLLGDDQVDVAQQRGAHIEDDLWLRDFTVNAMAIPFVGWLSETPLVIDPTGGQADLANRSVRAVTEGAFQYDPGRLLRAPRLAAQLGGTIEATTETWLKRDAYLLPTVSAERLRDEFWRCLLLPDTASILRELDRLGLLALLLPEVHALQGVTQRPPHDLDVYDHTLAALTQLEIVFGAIGIGSAESDAETVTALAPFRDLLHTRLMEEPVPGRPRWTLLKLAALLHDVGKPATRSDDAGQVHFYGHEALGAAQSEVIGHRLKLSSRELDWLQLITGHHMRPLQLSQLPQLSRRPLYHYFRDLGEAAPDLLVLAIADQRAKRAAVEQAVDPMLALTSRILTTYYAEPAEPVVTPPPLVNGHDLIQTFDLKPGPQIGEVLDQIREATATGEVTTAAEALDLARRILDQQG